MNKLESPVDLSTAHTKYVLPKWAYICFFIFVKGLNITGAAYISYLMYTKCLFNPDANTVVTAYFCIIGLSFFIGIGLPVDRFVKISSP